MNKEARELNAEYEMEKYGMQKNGNDEIYVPIRDYDDYEISNYGNVRKKSTGLILKILHLKIGQKIDYVSLSKDGIRKKFPVWKLRFNRH
jgi:hypothetical protein